MQQLTSFMGIGFMFLQVYLVAHAQPSPGPSPSQSLSPEAQPSIVPESNHPNIEQGMDILSQQVHEKLALRDPFRKPVTKARAPASVASPLQIESLEQIKVVAVLQDKEIARALIHTNALGNVFIKIGDFLGNNGGKVSRITESGLEIEEISVNLAGEEEIILKQILLPKEVPGIGVDKSADNNQDRRRNSREGNEA